MVTKTPKILFKVGDDFVLILTVTNRVNLTPLLLQYQKKQKSSRFVLHMCWSAAERIWAFLFGSNESSTLKGEHA